MVIQGRLAGVDLQQPLVAFSSAQTVELGAASSPLRGLDTGGVDPDARLMETDQLPACPVVDQISARNQTEALTDYECEPFQTSRQIMQI